MRKMSCPLIHCILHIHRLEDLTRKIFMHFLIKFLFEIQMNYYIYEYNREKFLSVYFIFSFPFLNIFN